MPKRVSLDYESENAFCQPLERVMGAVRRAVWLFPHSGFLFKYEQRTLAPGKIFLDEMVDGEGAGAPRQ